MSTSTKILSTLIFGVIIAFKGYVIVIGQTKPVLVALNKADATLSIIDPATMKVTGTVATGEGPHEVVLSIDGRTAYVANYGAQTPGSTLSIIDVATAKELKRIVSHRCLARTVCRSSVARSISQQRPIEPSLDSIRRRTRSIG